jgi:hypothetical protein
MAALPRYAAGDKIASLVAYLASPEAACLTGAGLSIDGIGLLVSWRPPGNTVTLSLTV